MVAMETTERLRIPGSLSFEQLRRLQLILLQRGAKGQMF